VIDLYVWPVSKEGDSAVPVLQRAVRNGYNTVHWSESGMDFWAVSDVEAAKLNDFVRDWRAGG
jgi:anti-sigma factor RsiW